MGAMSSNVIPSYNPTSAAALVQGNYIKNMYFQQVSQANFLIADN